MSRDTGSGQLRPLVFLHTAAMLALAVAWAFYCWKQSLLRLGVTGGRRRDTVFGLDRVLEAFQASLGDLLLGVAVAVLFGIGSGIYVRRIQVWLDARSSGEAVAYGGADLKSEALAANITHEQRS